MTSIFNRVSGFFGSHRPVEQNKPQTPVETRASVKRSHSLASTLNKGMRLRSRSVSADSPKSTSSSVKNLGSSSASQPDPATASKLTPDEYFAIVARPEPKSGPVRSGPLTAPARNEATDRALQEIDKRNPQRSKISPVAGEPLLAPARNEATERMLLDIESREVDGELDRLIRGLDENVFAPVDPGIMDTLPKAGLERAGKTAHRPEPTANWPEQLEAPVVRDFHTVANETVNAIDRAEANLIEQHQLQYAYDEAMRAVAGESKENRMPEMQRTVWNPYADFDRLLEQRDAGAVEDVKGKMEALSTGPNAAYRDFERIIDPAKPRSLERRGPSIGKHRQNTE